MTERRGTRWRALVGASMVVCVLVLCGGRWFREDSLAAPRKLRGLGEIPDRLRGGAVGGVAPLVAVTDAAHGTNGTSSHKVHENVTIRQRRRLHEMSVEDCDSMYDVAQNLRKNDKGLLAAAYALGFVTFVLVMTGISFIFGRYTKPKPPSYWVHHRSIFRPCSFFHDNYREEVDVTAQLGQKFQDLFDETTLSDNMGRGRDGHWSTHKAFKVVKVIRIEDGALWTRYQQVKHRIIPSTHVLHVMSSGQVEKAREGIQILRECCDQVYRSLGGWMALDRNRNEVLLFHGSPGAGARDAAGRVMFETEGTSPVGVIKRQGFDDRLGSVSGMYGSGTYFADKASKADCYAGRYNEFGESYTSVGEEATMFVSRVAMGTPYVTNQSLEQLRRPPCVQGHFDLNLTFNPDVKFGKPWKYKDGVEFKICQHPRFDSVIGDYQIEGMTKLYREYVVYDKQCYPEYCVKYRRKKMKGSTDALPEEGGTKSKTLTKKSPRTKTGLSSG